MSLEALSVVDILTAVAWRPNVGDTLTGAVVHKEARTTEHGTYPIVYFDVNMGDVTGQPLIAVHAFHQTLRDGLKELAPQRGQIVSITYAGLKESNKRTDSKGEAVEYHHYAVYDPEAVVESADIDWDSPEF